MVRKLGLTRSQIARIVGDDPEAIRQFERLFASEDATSTELTAVAALAELGAYLPLAPPITGTPAVDTINFARFSSFVPTLGRMGWDAVSETLSLGLDGGALLRIGFDTLCNVGNTSGATLTRGTVVRFVGVTAGNVLDVEAFTADGTQSPNTVVGILPEDIADGEEGYAMVFGILDNVDTSAFAAGNTVYASSTTPGALTATAPALAVRVGTVLLVSSTEGQILVRAHNGAGLGLAAITAPAGGATVDAEARTAISAIIARLQQAGITL